MGSIQSTAICASGLTRSRVRICELSSSFARPSASLRSLLGQKLCFRNRRISPNWGCCARKPSGVLFPRVHGGSIRSLNQEAIHNKFTPSQQIPAGAEVPNGLDSLSALNITAERLRNIIGHIQGVPAHSCARKSPEISDVQLSKPCLQIHSDTIRVGNSTPTLHAADAGSDETLQEARLQADCLSRRSVAVEPVPHSTEGTDNNASPVFGRKRFSHQREVRLQTAASVQISRNDLEFQNDAGDSFTAIPGASPSPGSKDTEQVSLDGIGLLEVAGTGKFPRLQSQNQSDCIPENSNRTAEKSGSLQSPITALVALPEHEECTASVDDADPGARSGTGPRCHLGSHDRCLRPRVGCTYKSAQHQLPVDRKSVQSPHQHQGVADGASNSSRVVPGIPKPVVSLTNRQPSGDALDSSRRHNNQFRRKQDLVRDSKTSRNIRPGSQSGVHSDQLQYSGGQSLQVSSGRMGTRPSNLQGVGCMAQTANRSIRISAKHQALLLRYSGKARVGSTIPQCLQSPLELDRGLRLSSSGFDSGSPPSHPRGQGHSTFSHTRVARCPLVSFSDEPLSGTSATTASSESANFQPEVQTVQSTGQTDTPSLVEAINRLSMHRGMQESTRALLLASWRKNTIKTYNFPWNRWIRYCQLEKVSWSSPSAVQLSNFVSWLYNLGLSPSSINTHRAAVSTVCQLYTGVQLGTDPLVVRTMKAIGELKPAKATGIRHWDISQLIRYLQSSWKPDLAYQDLQQRTAALLMIFAGRRISDLQFLSTEPENFRDLGKVMTFQPVYGRKTDTATRRSNPIRFRWGKDHRICPIRHIKALLAHEARRNSTCVRLFSSPTNVNMAAQVTNIRFWVSQILKRAGIAAAPGSIRRVAARSNFEAGVPMSDIQFGGNWARSSTVERFYLS